MVNIILQHARLVFVAFAILLLPILFTIGFLYKIVYLDRSETEAKLVIERGQSIAQIAQLLDEKDVISHPTIFKNIAHVYAIDHQYIKAGEYMFPRDITMSEVLDMLIDGDILERRIVIIEGDTVKNIIKSINAQEDLKGKAVAHDAYEEGAFLPNTYYFSFRSTKKNFLDQISSRKDVALEKEWNGRDKSIPLKSPEEALILASIVEKEALLTREMPIIASVYLNRIKKEMRLQADPTVIYGLSNGTGKLRRALTFKDLRKPNLYNTYINYGLPPTPICNPSLSAIHAVMHPDETEYLFFVANANGGHWFAESYKEHKSNIVRYKKARHRKRSRKKRTAR